MAAIQVKHMKFINMIYNNLEVLSWYDEDLSYYDCIKTLNLNHDRQVCILATPEDTQAIAG